jgi:hypothetical protein
MGFRQQISYSDHGSKSNDLGRAPHFSAASSNPPLLAIQKTLRKLVMSSSTSQSVPGFVRLWFLANAALLLLPPVHWLVNDHKTPVAGLPATLFYFIALSASIAASVVTAYVQESAGGGLK